MIVHQNLSPKEIVVLLNSEYQKKKGQKINLNDVYGYIKRGSTPKWLGNYKIRRNLRIRGVKLYHVVKLKENEI